MNNKHPCKGDYLDKFVQPIVLSLLCEGPAHGFKLLGEMRERGFAVDIDATGLYRSLQKLEQTGKLVCDWQIEPGQKPRKVYSITSIGVRCLQNWQQTLKDYSKHIEHVSNAIEVSLAKVEAKPRRS